MRVERKALPPAIKKVLDNVGYKSADLSLDVAETFHAPGGAGEGNRSFLAVVNLDTGESRIERGSWGGSNMFVQTVPDDLLKGAVPIPPRCVVVTGQEGYTPYARIIAPPGVLAPALPAPADVSEREKQILAVFGAIKSAYRREYFSTGKVGQDEIDSLVSRGLLSRNKAGSVAITTAGKNARGRTEYPYFADQWAPRGRQNPDEGEEFTEPGGGMEGGPKRKKWKALRVVRPQLVPVKDFLWKTEQISGSGSADKLIRNVTEIHLSDRENVAVICLNTKNFPMACYVDSIGGNGSVSTEPGQLFRLAVADGASAIIMAHNHPSGDPTPSEADRRFTEDAIKAGRTLGIRVLDHLVIARDRYFSFLDEGLLG